MEIAVDASGVPLESDGTGDGGAGEGEEGGSDNGVDAAAAAAAVVEPGAVLYEHNAVGPKGSGGTPGLAGQTNRNSDEYSADVMLHHEAHVSRVVRRELLEGGPPRVPIMCIYSHGTPTPGKFIYHAKDKDEVAASSSGGDEGGDADTEGGEDEDAPTAAAASAGGREHCGLG